MLIQKNINGLKSSMIKQVSKVSIYTILFIFSLSLNIYSDNPLDSDNDGMPDLWEITYGLNPSLNDADNDADNDGLSNLEEFNFSTFPNNVDTDNDGLLDGEEFVMLLGSESKIDPSSYPQNRPSVSSNGTTYLVTWESEYQDGDGYGIFGRFYDNNANQISNEFQINSYTTNEQTHPSVSSNGTTYLVTWKSYCSYEYGSVIYGQFYNNDGTPLGSEFQINSYTTYTQNRPSASVSSNGTTYLITWVSDGQDGESRSEIYGQFYNNDGTALGSEFQINTYTTSWQGVPSVSSNGTTYLITWSSNGQDGHYNGLYGRFYDNDGTALGSEFQINTYTISSQRDPSVSSNGTTYLITWVSYGQDGDRGGIYGQFYNNDGTALGSEFQINTYTTNDQTEPSVLSNGNTYLVTWKSSHLYGSGYEIYGKFYNNDGTPLSSEFQILGYGFSVSCNRTTYLVTGARGYDYDGDGRGIYGRFYNTYGVALGSEFQINTYTSGMQTYPSVSSNGDNYLVTWESNYGTIYGKTIWGGDWNNCSIRSSGWGGFKGWGEIKGF